LKFLVDENVSERVAELLVENGHDAIHVPTIGLATADDEVVMARATAEERVVVSADTDFGMLLARSGKRAPSVILFRLAGQRRAWSRAALILTNLPQVSDDLEAGTLVVIEEGRVQQPAPAADPGVTARCPADAPRKDRNPRVMADTGGHQKCTLTCAFGR
jgi:predicted nuclease of predicted toxin-antitoxin system